jgi:prevent-host-death family protein
MQMVNIHDAKTNFSRLVDAASTGEEIIIAKAGKPVARLVPIIKRKRPIGVLAGKVKISDSFYDPLPDDLLAAFEGG